MGATMRFPLGLFLLIALALAVPAAAQTQTPDAAARPPVAQSPVPPSGAGAGGESSWRDTADRSLATGGAWLAQASDFARAHDWVPLLLALFNALIVVFIFRLRKAVSGLSDLARELSRDLRQQSEIARDAADAAKQSAEAAALQARALVGVELPRLELGRAHLIYADQSVRQALKAPSVEIGFTNFGRTTAFLVERCIEVRMTPTLPPEPVYNTTETLQLVEAVESGGSVSASASRRLGDLAESQVQQLLAGTATLWVYGFIRFRDFLGMDHKNGFCLRWAPPARDAGTGGGFVPEGPPAYVYQSDHWSPPPPASLRRPELILDTRYAPAAE
jgi:hypothetical protein